MNLNSPFVQWALKFGLSKSGVLVAALAAQLASHVIVWLGLPAFVPADSLAQIHDGLEQGATVFGTALVTIIYAWLVHRQTAGVQILKEQLNLSTVATPTLDTTGSVGNDTLHAAAILTHVSVAEAQSSIASDARS